MRLSDAQARMLVDIWSRGFSIHVEGESATADALLRKGCLDDSGFELGVTGTYPTGKTWRKYHISHAGTEGLGQYFCALAKADVPS